MQVVEFEADAKGRMIEIPIQFTAFASKHLKIKLSIEEAADSTSTKPAKRLSALSIDTRSFQFDREDANAR
ncbi:hypothetical protein [Methylomonas rosea]|uniref:Uncharacterized protein n=1 Tax=Methylomonas rosea TaxID=2952227 RepID=A0ABT1TP89_9GAMM|nr:hypothetical protein [Methylomonas sp. WSC-7]MCQ8116585.1 hypothetical protein [Methylomonas sp. WSC-7]